MHAENCDHQHANRPAWLGWAMRFSRQQKPPSYVFRIMLGLLVGLAMSSCASTREMYEDAYTSHDPEQMQRFIESHPGDRYIAAAKREQAKWLMAQAEKNPSIESYESLLKKYPQNPNLYTQATNKLSALYFDKAIKSKSISAMEDFTARFPFSRERHFAAVQIDQLKFDHAVAENTRQAYQQYLDGKPSQQNRLLALDKMAALELKEIEKQPSAEAYKAFIDKYKDSSVVAEATSLMGDLQLPSSSYDSQRGPILLHWGKISKLRGNQLNAHYGKEQKQKFALSKNVIVCNDGSKRLNLNDLTTNHNVTLASFADAKPGEIFAIYLGEVKSKLIERDTVLSPGAPVAFQLPSCFPPQLSVNR